MKKKVAKRAVHIAAVVMRRAGLCVYQDEAECHIVGEPPEEEICAYCLEKWLLKTAKKVMRKHSI